MKLFKKILIANRGEIAVRIIRACKELGIKTVAVYSDIDRQSYHAQLAEESVCIGPAQVSQSYNNIPGILTAAEITDSEAIHPGYGFLAENAQLAEACIASGITFIGPSPESIKLGGNKSEARLLMKRKGVPVVPGSDGPVISDKMALKVIKKIGFPVMIKASAGGGGKGMRVALDANELEKFYAMAQKEAIAAFGNGELYIEKFIPEMRHVEVQIIADGKGTTLHFGERDCSVQRRHQKLIEESPSPGVTERLRKKIGEYAVKAAKAFKYKNAGTVEFIVDTKGKIFFIEMNTRLQVEHPVTECVSGVDLVKEQIRVAAGLPLGLKQSQIKLSGHSIECRINAEDPDKFIPSPGKITFLSLPYGPGVRVDTALFDGYVVPPDYDSLIAKLIVHGRDRQEAIARMKRALDEFHIEGIQTTIPFHKKVLNEPDFINGSYNTGLLERINGNKKTLEKTSTNH
jgi:acetyl-CoA carboxylase biotin carboxylase subunit